MSVERKWAFRIEHILEAIAKIQRYTQGMTEESFAADERTVDAVIRNFQVIGEAVRHVPRDVQARYQVRDRLEDNSRRVPTLARTSTERSQGERLSGR
jgi:hypothetical protein